MKPSFGVVLAVRNAELYLSPFVHEVLDALSELATSFELLIVDDASTDHTAELIDELDRKFPQVRVLTQPKRLGLVESARRGLRLVRGERTHLLHGRPPLDVAGLRRAWQGLSTAPPICEHTTRRWKLHQRWREWSAGHRLLRPIHRRVGTESARLPRILSSPTHREADTTSPVSPAHGSLSAQVQARKIVKRPDTVEQQCRAALIPIRRKRRSLAQPSMFVSRR